MTFVQNQDETVSVLSEHSAPNNANVGCEPPDYGIQYLLFNCDSGRTLSETVNSNSLVFACAIKNIIHKLFSFVRAQDIHDL